MRTFSPARSLTVAVVLGSTAASGLLAVDVTLNSGRDTTIVVWIVALAFAALARATLRGRSTVGIVMVYSYLAFGFAAAVLYHPTALEFNGGNSYVAYFAAATPNYRYLAVFAVAAFSIWLAFFILAPRRSTSHSLGRLADFGSYAPPVIALPSIAIVLAMLPLALDVYGTGLHTALYASAYLQRTGPLVAFKVGRGLGAIGLLVAGYLIFADRSVRLRLLATFVAVCYAALYLGTDTRFFGLVVPMLYLGGLLSGKWNARQRNIGFVIAVVAAVFMVEVPIGLRGLPQHGLVASVKYISQNPGLLLTDPINNVLFGAPLTLYVAHRVPAIPWHDFITSLSPLPSSFTDWSQIQPTLELNSFTPYSALGELLNHGWLWLGLTMTAFGALYALLERLVTRSLAPRLGLLLLSSVAAVSVVRSTEYNLRTMARAGYYVAFVIAVLAAVPSLSRRVGRVGPSSSSRPVQPHEVRAS